MNSQTCETGSGFVCMNKFDSNSFSWSSKDSNAVHIHLYFRHQSSVSSVLSRFVHGEKITCAY